MQRLIWIGILWTCWSAGAVGQSPEYTVGILPALNLHHVFSPQWRLNTKAETRVLLVEQDPGEPWVGKQRLDLADLTGMVVWQGLGRGSVAIGGLGRWRDDRVTLRAIQQIAWVDRWEGLRVGHRVRTDQTWREGPPVLRLRYRLTGERALQGQRVDLGEPYLKMGLEGLAVWREAQLDGEARIVPAFGWRLPAGQRLEVGMDLRFSEFREPSARQRHWMTISWYRRV